MSINLYPSILLDGDVSPDDFGNEVDDICNEINEATRGFGTNEHRLIKALATCTPEARCKIPARYYQLYGQALVDVIKSECGDRPLGTALQYLAVDPVHAECEMIEEACKGFGTDESLLFSIISGRSNAEIALLKNKYKALNNRNLERHLCVETSGNVENLIKWLLEEAEEEYDEEVHTEEKMEEDAERFHSMGEGRWGTNEGGMFKMLCTSPPQYLKGVNNKYEEKYGNDLSTAIKKEMSGVLEKATLTLLGMKLNPYVTAADFISEAVRGFGTNELMLTIHLIRFQNIMPSVSAAYEEKYNLSLKNVVRREVSGQFETLLVELAETFE